MEKEILITKEYIESKEYFYAARKWYANKYLTPLVERSWLSIIGLIFTLFFVSIGIQIYLMLPLHTKVKYAIETKNDSLQRINIIGANYINNNPQKSIADILIRNYVISRESYDYSKLTEQFNVVLNNSSKMVYRKFYDYMSIDNPLSPVLRYQKDNTKRIILQSVKYLPDEEVEVIFQATVQNSTNQIIENILWQANLTFLIDEINPNVITNEKFNFFITSYQLKLLKDLTKLPS